MSSGSGESSSLGSYSEVISKDVEEDEDEEEVGENAKITCDDGNVEQNHGSHFNSEYSTSPEKEGRNF